MKRSLILYLAFIFLASFISCDEETAPEEVVKAESLKYYPGKAGTEFTYKQDTALLSPIINFRKAKFLGEIKINGVDYMIQENELYSGMGPAYSDSSYFRRTEQGIYIYVDTSGINALIPDTLKNSGVLFNMSNEILAFCKIEGLNAWDVYKMTISYGLFAMEIISATAAIVGTETLTLRLESGDVVQNAIKVKYDLNFKIPDLSNPLNSKSQNFEAYAWFAENIGLVKTLGNAVLLNAIKGAGINFIDSTKTAGEDIYKYVIVD